MKKSADKPSRARTPVSVKRRVLKSAFSSLTCVKSDFLVRLQVLSLYDILSCMAGVRSLPAIWLTVINS